MPHICEGLTVASANPELDAKLNKRSELLYGVFVIASVAWMERERNPGWHDAASYSPDFTSLYPGYGVVVDPDLP